MNWLKRKASRRDAPSTAGQREAGRALAREEEKLRRITAETSEILEAAEKLKRLGSRNDFAARIHRALGGA